MCVCNVVAPSDVRTKKADCVTFHLVTIYRVLINLYFCAAATIDASSCIAIGMLLKLYQLPSTIQQVGGTCHALACDILCHASL